MAWRVLVTAATAMLALCAGTAATASRSAESCDAEPVVEQFFAALKARRRRPGSTSSSARGRRSWRWYSISDRVGQRLGAASMQRARCGRTSRRASRSTRSSAWCGSTRTAAATSASPFSAGPTTCAADSWVQRGGKGWVSCTTGKLNVWSLGGAPPPRTFGPCPQGTLPLARTDLAAASKAVLRFVRDVYSEMAPAYDVTGARVTQAALAPGNVLGLHGPGQVRPRDPAPHGGGRGAAATRHAVQIRAARLLRVAHAVGWLVWRLVPR